MISLSNQYCKKKSDAYDKVTVLIWIYKCIYEYKQFLGILPF